MDLLGIIAAFAIIGFCLYLVIEYVPMPEPMKQALIVIVVIVLVFYVARLLLGGNSSLRLP